MGFWASMVVVVVLLVVVEMVEKVVIYGCFGEEGGDVVIVDGEGVGED